MEILKFNDFSIRDKDILEKIIEGGYIITEKNDNKSIINDILEKLKRELNFNFSLVFTFGTGIGFMYPIVESLISNSGLKIDLNPENITLISLTVISIIYLEQKRGDIKKGDVKNLLKEVQLRCGVSTTSGGVLDKLVKIFKTIGDFFITDVFKKIPQFAKYSLTNLIDMFAYTSILIPTLNFVKLLIGQCELTLDNFIGNLTSIGVSLTSLIIKHGFNWFLDKLGSKELSNKVDLKELDIDKSEILN